MIKKLINIWSSSEQNNLKTPENVTITFKLSYKDIKIGYLNLNNGIWKYEYSNEFKNQNSLLPLIDFPDINKNYESKDLWPFFMSRIPGMGQPMVQEIIKKEKVQEDDEVSLLKLFGKRTIANPYTLEPSL